MPLWAAEVRFLFALVRDEKKDTYTVYFGPFTHKFIGEFFQASDQ